MALLIERSENVFMRINGNSTSDPVLKNLSQMISLAKRIIDLCRGPPGSHYDQSMAA